MHAIRNFVFKFWMPMFIGISLVYVTYYIYGQLDSVGETIEFSLVPLLGSALFQVVFWVLTAHLWTVLLLLASGRKVPLSDGFFQLCLITLGKYIPGKIWGVVARASYTKQRHGIDIGRMVQATYVEQIYLIGSGTIVASLLAAALGINDLLWLLAIVVLLLVVGATVYQKPMTALIRRFHKLREPDAELELADIHLPPVRMIVVLLLYMVGWLLLGLVMYGLYLSLFEAGLSLRMAAIIAMSCATGVCAGFLALFAPGGVGVREAVSGGILAAYMPLADAVLLVLIFRLWLAALDVVVGGTLYLWHTRR
jgi:hypothetical protein